MVMTMRMMMMMMMMMMMHPFNACFWLYLLYSKSVQWKLGTSSLETSQTSPAKSNQSLVSQRPCGSPSWLEKKTIPTKWAQKTSYK